jgi:hypothetical protein
MSIAKLNIVTGCLNISNRFFNVLVVVSDTNLTKVRKFLNHFGLDPVNFSEAVMVEESTIVFSN